MKKTVISIFLLGAFCILSISAHAQACYIGVQACVYDTGGHPGGNTLAPQPPGNSQCAPSTIWCVQCWLRASVRDYACAPLNVQNDCPNCPKPSQVGGPIDTATGNTYISETDISIPGLGGGLKLTRKWNSIMPPTQQTYPFMFGANWRSNFEQRLVFNPGEWLKFAGADTSVSTFGAASYNTTANGETTIYNAVVPSNDTTTAITENFDGTNYSYSMLSKDGETRIFAPKTGVLLSITDRNGNLTQLTYDASNRLTTVTDPASRHLYFNYTSPTSNLVGSVTTDFGITVSYTYDDQGRLTQVTKQDNTTISFAYDANSNIITVTDANGKVLESHTYDASHRGLTSSKANGVQAVTLSY